jgi:hypothetical protein
MATMTSRPWFVDGHALRRRSRTLICFAWVACAALASATAQPAAASTQEVTTEVLNFSEAPFEILPGPEDESDPVWGRMVNLSFFVRNTSNITLYQVTVRVTAFNAAEPFPGTQHAWRAWSIDLGRPAGLEPGEKAYVLDTVYWGECWPFATHRGAVRFVVMSEAAEGFRSFAWRKKDSRGMRPMPLASEARPQLIAKSRIDPADRPAGTSACAALRQQALTGCLFGLDDFQCVAPPQGEPRVVEQRCTDADEIRRREPFRKDPKRCRQAPWFSGSAASPSSGRSATGHASVGVAGATPAGSR